MLEKTTETIGTEAFKKSATIYKDSQVETKAAILYFHGEAYSTETEKIYQCCTWKPSPKQASQS